MKPFKRAFGLAVLIAISWAAVLSYNTGDKSKIAKGIGETSVKAEEIKKFLAVLGASQEISVTIDTANVSKDFKFKNVLGTGFNFLETEQINRVKETREFTIYAGIKDLEKCSIEIQDQAIKIDMPEPCVVAIEENQKAYKVQKEEGTWYLSEVNNISRRSKEIAKSTSIRAGILSIAKQNIYNYLNVFCNRADKMLMINDSLFVPGNSPALPAEMTVKMAKIKSNN